MDLFASKKCFCYLCSQIVIVQMRYSFDNHTLNMERVVNARELGGYVLPDGRRIRRGLLLRGGDLGHASDNDVRRLSEEYKVAYVFDFRTEGEVIHLPDRNVPGARNVWMPTIDPETEQLSNLHLPVAAYRDLENFLFRNSSDETVQNVARQLYPALVDNEYTQLQYAAFIQTIVKMIKSGVSDRAVYWHCSQGKDRTGLGATFLLLALGADEELILEDFNLSNQFYKEDVDRLIERIRARGGNEDDFDTVRAFVGVSEKNYISTLNSIVQNYGSLQGYLSDAIMVSEDDINLLKAYFLE